MHLDEKLALIGCFLDRVEANFEKGERDDGSGE